MTVKRVKSEIETETANASNTVDAGAGVNEGVGVNVGVGAHVAAVGRNKARLGTSETCEDFRVGCPVDCREDVVTIGQARVEASMMLTWTGDVRSGPEARKDTDDVRGDMDIRACSWPDDMAVETKSGTVTDASVDAVAAVVVVVGVIAVATTAKE